jgi:RNA polymerase sigma factor (sigma-70 family)
LSEKTALYFDVLSVKTSSRHSSPSTEHRRLDQRNTPRAVSIQDCARIRGALGQHRIPLQDREDLGQAILLALLEGWQTRGSDVADPERWLNGIIANHVRRFRQRRWVDRTRNEEEADPDAVAIEETCNAEDFSMSVDRRRLLNELFQHLPDDHLDAVIMRECYEFTFEEIAETFDMPVSTVYGYYTAGMRELRAGLKRWQAKHRERGLLCLPLTLEALFYAGRTAPPPPVDEETERAWRRFQQRLADVAPASVAPASGPRPMRVRRFPSLNAPPVIGYLLAHPPSADAAHAAAAPLDGTPAPVARVDVSAAMARGTLAASAPGLGASAPILLRSASAAPRLQAGPAASTDAHQDRAGDLTERVTFDKARAAFRQRCYRSS